MQPTMIPDDDDSPTTTTLEFCSVPRVPEHLTVEQATALRAEIWASDGLPDHAKARLSQQIDYRLEEAAGKVQQQPQSVSAGVLFCGAQPDEVMRQLKALADQR